VNLLVEAAARRWEREHNARAWLAWTTAALQRSKKLPDIKKLYLNNTAKTRQTWQQQHEIMMEWATKQKQAKQLLKEIDSG
jgi:hypothetical protein